MILVTGGLGFIGSHIALSLLARGHEIVIVDNLANSTLQTLERLEYISGMYIPFAKLDVRNTPALNKVFEQYSIDTVIHTASFKSLEESVLKPLEYYNDNVSSIMSLLRAMQRMGVRQLVNISSLAVYGKSDDQLIEDTEFNYTYSNPYIRSQQMVEDIIADTYKVDHDWKMVNLRLSNIVGAFEHGVLGNTFRNCPKISYHSLCRLPRCKESALNSKIRQILLMVLLSEVFACIDACDAVLASLHWLSTQQGCLESFNIAHNDLTSISKLIEEISKVTKWRYACSQLFINMRSLVSLGRISIRLRKY